jgi:uncharacterized protein YfaS (alpha-2-macroglobulin family)
MNHRIVRLLPLLFALLLLASGARAESLALIGQVPLPGDPIGKEIVLFFNEPIVVPPAEDGQPGQPFTLDPPLAGTFRVENNFAAFFPESLPAETRVAVTLNPLLRGASGAPADSAPLYFGSSPFEPLRTRVYSDEGSNVRIGFETPYPVRAADLAAHLAVVGYDGKALTSELIEAQDGTRFQAWIRGEATWPVQLSLTAGLTDDSGQIALLRDSSAPCPSLPPLTVNGVTWGEFAPDRQMINIAFSDAVLPGLLSKHVIVTELATGKVLSTTPATPTAAATQQLRIALEQPGQARIAVLVQEGLNSKAYTRLMSPFETTLERTQLDFDITNLWWYSEGRDGAVLVLGSSKPLREVASAEVLLQHIQVEPAVENLRAEYRTYGSDFVLKGEWTSGQSYTLTINAGLPTDIGQTLTEDITREVTAEAISPYAGFPHEGKFYFPRRSGGALHLETRNIARADLKISRLFPSNLPAAVNAIYNGSPDYDFTDRFTEELVKQTLDIAAPKDRLARTPLAFDTLVPQDKRGVFVVEASPEEGNDETWWSRAQKLVVFTDLGVLAHWQDKELAVFVHGLYTLAPEVGAKVTLYSAKNQVLAEARTNDQGVCMINALPERLGAPKLVLVETASDYTFLQLEARSDDLTEMDRATDPYPGDRYEAFVYADRDLYRPGETVHLHWIARQANGNAVAGAPVELKVLKPNGQELSKETVTLTALGTGGFDLLTDKMYPTGRYEAQLYVPGERMPMGTYTFRVEDFVPNRLKSTVTVDQPVWRVDQEYPIKVNAQHLFGAPASDRKVSAWVVYQRTTGVFPDWKGFRFDNDSTFTAVRVPLGEARTDGAGDTTFTYAAAAPQGATFPLRGYVFGEVFELGGRSVLGKAEATLVPSEIALGIAADTEMGPSQVTVSTAAVTPDGKPADLGEVTVTLEQQTWSYYVRRYYSNLESNWSERYTPVETRTVTLEAGRGSTVFNVQDWGYYRIKVSSPATPQYSTTTLFSYGDEVHVAESNRPSLIKLQLDKESYLPGETAQLRIESPFDGKAMVLLQGANLKAALTVDIQDKVGVAAIPLTADCFPNVWAEVTVINRVKEGETSLHPYSTFGLINLPVADPARTLKVAFEALPEQITPSAEQSFSIAVTTQDGQPAQGEITLAAIDEGIHGITDYRDPDPIRWFARLRRADIRRAHFYDKVVFDYETLSPGGDLAAQLARRVVPPLENWIKPVALWSGPVTLDAGGRAVVAMQVPEFTGQLRLVAVAASASATAATRANVFVRRPHMLKTSMPRFLLPADAASCRAVLYNHSDADCVAAVSWTTSGALTPGEGGAEVAIPAKGEASVVAPITAGAVMGQGVLQWTVVFRDGAGAEVQRLTEEALLPVNPPAVYQSTHALLRVEPGAQAEVMNTELVDDALLELDMTASANPAWRLKNALKDVVEYPYGCVEQTTSRCFPLFMVRQSEALLGSTVGTRSDVDSMLRVGIARLFAMQTDTGGLGYWPGANSDYPYGSVYALHFLTVVKADRTIRVSEGPFKKLQQYVRGLIELNDETPSGLFLRAYALYALGLGGDLDALQQISRFDHLPLPAHGRYLLAAALALQTGDQPRVMQYLKSTPVSDFNEIESSSTLNSPTRNLALEVIAKIQIEQSIANVHEPVQRLISFLEGENHGTTQEQAFVITAVSLYLALLGGDLSQASSTVVAPEGEASIVGSEVHRVRRQGPGAPVVVKNTGKVPVFVDVTWRGTPLTPPTEAVSNGITVQRQFYTMGGAANTDRFFRQGDTYVAMIELTIDQPVENIVVADLLPGGLEVINPRLAPDALPSSLSAEVATPQYLEIRDDRVVYAFDTLGTGKHKLYYVVQAVTPGKWTQPGMVAECMYDAAIQGTTLASQVTVTETP